MMPRLMPCNSSPAPGSSSRRKKSTMERRVVSLWPTPTLSTRTTSNPAASQSSMVSRVRRATPPTESPAGEGRMKARASRLSRSMRVLSPRMLPPDRLLEGSMVSTATAWPLSTSTQPSASMNVLLPTPGTPVMPTRLALPVRGNTRCRTSCAAFSSNVAWLSISVIARDSTTRSPAMMPET